MTSRYEAIAVGLLERTGGGAVPKRDGIRSSGRRGGYYKDGEDAYFMRKELGENGREGATTSLREEEGRDDEARVEAAAGCA